LRAFSERSAKVETITITLDGVPISGRAGMTILELAREVGVRIPTLCHDPCLKPFGACRICVVEDEASGRLLASCVTPIAPRMRILTRSDTVLDTRRVILKLMMANHPESCLVCDKGNQCQLRQLAAEHGIGMVDYDRMPSYSGLKDLNPFIVRDLSKCIMCAKCIRADQELVVVGALDYLHRGFHARPATLMDGPLEGSGCTFCGTCVSMCPTGALMEKALPHRGNVGKRSAVTCSFCGCGCSLWVYTLQGRLVKVSPKAEDSVNRATLCARGHYGGDYLLHPERLKSPMIRRQGELQPASWQEALEEVVQALGRIRDYNGPSALGFFGSAQCTNEENYLFQKLARKSLGSPNVDNGARFHAISGVMALRSSLGVGATTNSLEDLESAQVILVLGAHPTETHPVAGYYIKRAVRHMGAKLVMVTPFGDELSHMAHLWIRNTPGSELLVIWGMIRWLLEEGPRGKELAEGAAPGWEETKGFATGLDPSEMEALSGVDMNTVGKAAALLSSTRRCAIVFGPGISQSPSAYAKIQALSSLGFLLGCLGVGGGGIYALDKGANSQGACDMGTLPEWLPGYRPADDPGSRAEFSRLWGKELPEEPGWTICEMMEAAATGRLKGLYVLGENPAAVLPKEAQEALARLEFLVVQDIFLTETAKLAHVVLPGAGFAEKEGTYTSLERRVQRIRPAMEPPGDARADWWILSEISRRLDGVQEYDSASDIMKEICAVVPAYGGIEYSRLDRCGLFWPCLDGRSFGEPTLYRDGLKGSPLPLELGDPRGSLPVREQGFPLLAVRGDTHFHFQSATRSGRSRRLSAIFPLTEVLLNPEDLSAAGLSPGDRVRMVSSRGSAEAVARGSEAIPKGVARIIPGPANPLRELARWSWDPVTKMPQLYFVSIKIEAAR
jgi:formate dehydrogenase alpha subunit